MKLLVLAVLVYAAASSAQLFGPGGLGAIGSDLGSRVGSGVGLGIGTVMDTVPKVFGIGRRQDPVPERPISVPVAPVRPRGPLYRDDGYGGRARDRGSSIAGRREYERRGADGDYEKGRGYSRERSVNERDRGTGYDSGRGRQGGERGRESGRSDSYGRERAEGNVRDEIN